MRRFIFTALALLLAAPIPVLAQMEDATPGGLRAYTHVFIAYAIVWLFIGGWILVISRRLARVSRDFGD